MSKSIYDEVFDSVEADENLKNDVLNRIENERARSFFSPEPNEPPRRNERHRQNRTKLFTRMVAGFIVVAMLAMATLPILLQFNRPIDESTDGPNWGDIINNRPQTRPPIPGENMAFAVESEEHLQYLFNINENRPNMNDGGVEPPPDIGDPDDGDAAGDGDRDNSGPTSETNIQVDGMDEGDIVRNDGNYIYRLSPQGLTIVRTNRGQITPVFFQEFTNFSPIEMFTRGNRMIIIGGTWEEQVWGNNDLNDRELWTFRSWHQRVQFRIYDITNRANPQLEQFFEIDGWFNTSRVRMETETLFFVVNASSIRWISGHRWNPHTNRYEWYGRREVSIPHFRTCESEELRPLPISNIFFTVEGIRMHNFMLLGSIELTEPDSEPNVKGYLTTSGTVSISRYNLYTTTTVWTREHIPCDVCEDCDPSWLDNVWCVCDWCMTHADRPDGCEAVMGQWLDWTYIGRFCLETLYYSGTAVVLGRPPSRHAISEYNGYLRVATTYGSWWNWWWGGMEDSYFASAIFVFNYRLELVSYILGIAPGETLDSATFTGNFGYISTSPPNIIWDPLFTVDFTDPYNPILSEPFEPDGINMFLRAIPGTGLAIGIGPDAPPEGSALQIGIKIELFDMRPGTGLAPISLSKYTIYGSWTWGEILWNSRALLFMFDEETLEGFVGFSATAEGLSGSNWEWATYAQGFYLFAIDGYAGTLTFMGETRTVRDYRIDIDQDNWHWTLEPVYVEMLMPISNFNRGINLPNIWNQSFSNWEERWNAWQERQSKFIYRAVVNNGYLFTVSDNMIVSYNLFTLELVDTFVGNY